MAQQFITNASERFDGHSTRTIRYFSDTRNPLIRLIEIEARDIDWQHARYSSGLFFCVTPQRFDTLRHLLDNN